MDHDNRTGWIVGLGCAILLGIVLVWLIAGCSMLGGTQCTHAAQAAVEQKWTEINVDGVVTPDETKAYLDAVRAALQVEKEESKTGWDGILTGFATGSVPAGLAALLLNMFRNKREEKVWGTPENPKPTGPAKA